MKLLGQALLAVVFVVALGAGVAGAQTRINGCTTITSSGSYVLSKDITASASDLSTLQMACIVIAADLVTLDLAGHTISGPGADSGNNFGITNLSTPSSQGITVKSGTVMNFGYSAILLQGSGMIVEHVRVMNNGYVGISVSSPLGSEVNGHRIVGNIVIGNGAGILNGHGMYVQCPAVVLENVASGNGSRGLDYQILVSGIECTRLENSPAP